jgi:hypothetical protein
MGREISSVGLYLCCETAVQGEISKLGFRMQYAGFNCRTVIVVVLFACVAPLSRGSGCI